MHECNHLRKSVQDTNSNSNAMLHLMLKILLIHLTLNDRLVVRVYLTLSLIYNPKINLKTYYKSLTFYLIKKLIIYIFK